MARVSMHYVPPELMGAWRATFRGQTYLIFPGNHLQTLNNAVRKKQPAHTEPPHVATPKQLKVRVAFSDAGHMIHRAPYRERHAYWRLSANSGMHSMHYYRHRIIPKLYDGDPALNLERPQTSVHEDVYQNGWAQMTMWGMSNDPQVLTYDIEADPGTPFPPNHDVGGAQIILFEQVYWEDDPEGDHFYVYLSENPTERSRYQGAIELPARTGAYSRVVSVWKHTQELVQCFIVWRLSSTLTPEGIDGYQMTPDHMDNEE